MNFLTSVIVLLRKGTIKLSAFDLESPVHEGHDKLKLSRRATEMKTVLDDVTSKLFVQSNEDMKGLVKEEMSLTDKPHMHVELLGSPYVIQRSTAP